MKSFDINFKLKAGKKARKGGFTLERRGKLLSDFLLVSRWYGLLFYIWFFLFPDGWSLTLQEMVKPTQIIRREIADELFECVWPFCGIGA